VTRESHRIGLRALERAFLVWALMGGSGLRRRHRPAQVQIWPK
jgi:hypothetical protein